MAEPVTLITHLTVSKTKAKKAMVSESPPSAQRSAIMRAVNRKNTGPEMTLRRALHAQGIRYRLHAKHLPGSPDIVFPRYHAVVFVHGCFWHRHAGCRYTTTPSTRREFWQAKFEANVARDSAVRATLLESGWRVATVWECALRKLERVELATDRLASWLWGNASEFEIGEMDAIAHMPGGQVVSLNKNGVIRRKVL